MSKNLRKRLTPARVLDAAFVLVDEGGADALTMRSLARRLGVAPMAAYNHFADRDALLDALADRAFMRPPAEKSTFRRRSQWKSRLRTILTGIQKVALMHPHIYRLAITRPTKPASAFQLMPQAMEALREAGLSNTQAATAYHTFLMLLLGYPFWSETFERRRSQGAPFPPGATVPSQAMLDWTTIHQVDSVEQFTLSLDWLLNSVSETARSQPRRPGVERQRRGKQRQAPGNFSRQDRA
jgi:AcrR family transcriptional regulator